MSHLYYLIGPPGSGKRTVGKELCRLTGAVLIDNHLINDPIFSAWGSDGNTSPPPEIWALTGQVRSAVMQAVELAPAGQAHVLTNYLANNEQEWQAYHALEALAGRRKVKFVPVWLTCPTSELEDRMAAPERRERLKLNDATRLREVLAEHGILPPPEGAFTLDTSLLSPAQAAREILKVTQGRA